MRSAINSSSIAASTASASFVESVPARKASQCGQQVATRLLKTRVNHVAVCLLLGAIWLHNHHYTIQPSFSVSTAA